MTMFKRTATLVLVGALALNLFGCGSKNDTQKNSGDSAAPATQTTPASQKLEGTVTLSGSTALLPLVQAAKEQFEAKNEKVTINVSGGGSFNGLSQVSAGAVQIGNSDVAATSDMKDLVDHKVAVAPFMIIVNPDVTATNVTKEQLAKIFRGEITNWKDVGGKDAKITVMNRAQSSGSRATVVATIMGGKDEMSKDSVVKDSSGQVFDAVASTPGAIGYIDAAYFKAGKVNALKLDGVEYSAQAVIDGKWPIYAYEHMYTKGEATGVVKAFLDFMVSPDFQNAAVEKLGFIPMSKMKQ